MLEYDPSLERQMLSYFGGQADGEYPTFSDFAKRIGVSYADLVEWRDAEPRFRTVWEECRERQKNRLILGALMRKFDPTFTKFLLCHEFGFDEENIKEDFRVTVEVVD